MHRSLLCVIFCLSGASALIFEAAWFQLLGLTLGNSVWASTIVLAAFMAGLAIGSALVAFKGDRITHPLRLFACLEVIIGVTGFAMILVLPHLTTTLKPLFQSLADGTASLNGFRAGFAFGLLLIPAASMGMTLPILVRALGSNDRNFGKVIALLYGFNTLGAAGGVMASELWITPAFGITGAGIVALGCNLFNAVAVLALARQASPATAEPAMVEPAIVEPAMVEPAIVEPAIVEPPATTLDSAVRGKPARILATSFLCGFCLLALEVLWFRFLLTFFSGFGLNFAIMLMVVLLGIAGGSLVASRWFRRNPEAHGYLAPLLGGAGVYVLFAYNAYQLIAVDLFPEQILVAAVFLMLPVALISGAAFTMLGRALHAELGDDVRSTGVLTLANTLGGAVGSLAAGLLILPLVGVENGFAVIAVLYGVVSFLVRNAAREPLTLAQGRTHLAILAALLLAAVTFRFGHMESTYSLVAHAKLTSGGEKRVYYREGPVNTLQYLQRDLFGVPYYHRLVTDNHSMSATTEGAKRYMKLYVYWPMAVNPECRDALLICFGCGSTAKALTDSKSLQHIDVVDISGDVIAASDVVFPDPADNPIHDSRVDVHIEDGRFFLQTTPRKYDIITAEPPPLRHRGVASLYSEEFFRLAHDRLTDRGVVSYWLPITQISVEQAKAVLRAFTNVFEHASLWQGAGFNLMMVGMKSIPTPAEPAAFTRQWQEQPTSVELRMLGLTSPEQFGSLYIADGKRLEEWCGEVAPLTDDFANRLGHAPPGPAAAEHYRALMNWQASSSDFKTSKLIASIWPKPLIDAAEPHFRVRNLINEMLMGPDQQKINSFEALHACLSSPMLRDYSIWTLGSTFDAQRRISASTKAPRDYPRLVREHPNAALHLAARAVFEGEFTAAANIYGALARNLHGGDPQKLRLTGYRVYLLYRAGHKAAARRAMDEFLGPAPTQEQRDGGLGFWNWLSGSFAVEAAAPR